MPPQIEFYSIFIAPLEQSLVRYMVTGSIASTIYGEPRLTHDIDIVIALKISDIESFRMLFPDDQFYCPPPEVIKIELNRNQFSHFNLIHHESGLKADCYPFTGDPLHAWGLKNRKRTEIGTNMPIWVAPPEYVIIRKLQFFREGKSQKHISDIKKILRSGVELDSQTLDEMIVQYELLSQWRICLSNQIE